ncbi:hypothetical protein KSP39_PZI005790 [Platanthera zijinensis]|uniref:Reverse transcriptase Ty1/copia-type domain-containing protein n=1 Tax=Platanthera zijinensis TaxID=2320716 RepID=A0AAP0BTH8_9ASPA
MEGRLGLRIKKLRTDNGGPLEEQEPFIFEDATGVKEWDNIMDEEMSAHRKNETWDLVPKVNGVTHVTCNIFIKKRRKIQVLELLYVEDMIITGNFEEELARLRAELTIQFEMKDLDELYHFLGLEIERKESGILVSQSDLRLPNAARQPISSADLPNAARRSPEGEAFVGEPISSRLLPVKPSSFPSEIQAGHMNSTEMDWEKKHPEKIS